MRIYGDHGSIVVHAAGADYCGDGVVACGPRAAGKTTVLTSLLRGVVGRLLSNDRLLLDAGGELVPVPLPVLAGRGTVEAIPDLTRAAARLSRPQPRLDTLPVEFAATVKAEFTPVEYATALSTSLARRSRLHTLVVPQLTDTTDPVQVRRCTTTQAHAALVANCFTPRDEFWRPWLVPRATADADLERHARHVIDRVVPSVRCLAVRFGIRNPLVDLDTALAHALRATP
ncbi:MAG: hypothetical protein GEU96_21365 [Propionibacteriales bacterium]|nr:hypothetical protein [Propionibacteriales bacterium]